MRFLLLFALAGYHWVKETPRGVQKVAGESLVRLSDNKLAAVCLQMGDMWRGTVAGDPPNKATGYETVESCKAAMESAVQAK